MGTGIETVLLGAAAKAGTAATTGLIGAGGQIAAVPMLQTMGAVGGLASGVGGVAGQKSAASNEMRLKRSQQALQMAEQERAREDDLRKTLAKQNAWFAAQGTSQGSGSALSIANAAEAQMQKQALSAERSNALVQKSFDLQERGSKSTGNAGIANSLLDFASSKNGQAIGNSIVSAFK